jgi:Restriction endonuclease
MFESAIMADIENQTEGRTINASQVLFIKLGEKGCWEKDCIEGPTTCIHLGFRSKQHKESLAGNWEAVREYWRTTGGKSEGKATEFTNQVKAFYTAREDTLWVTFYRRKLWWCFTSPRVEELPDGYRIRHSIGPWSCKDSIGNELDVDKLSGTLTKVQNFRGTICNVKEREYLLRRLNGSYPNEVKEAEKSLEQLEITMGKLVRLLTWKDFELLCDLIFTHAGWQRITVTGGTEKTIDMELVEPVTGRQIFVQIKSEADLKTFREWEDKLKALDEEAQKYFVVHSPSPDLAAHRADRPVSLLTTETLARLVVSAGLSRWLMQKTS